MKRYVNKVRRVRVEVVLQDGSEVVAWADRVVRVPLSRRQLRRRRRRMRQRLMKRLRRGVRLVVWATVMAIMIVLALMLAIPIGLGLLLMVPLIALYKSGCSRWWLDVDFDS